MRSLFNLVAPATRSKVAGSVDGLYRGLARGWAMDLDEPTSRLTVRMVDASGRVIARGLADRYRADVQKAGYGDGYYGFALPAAPHILEVARFLCGGRSTELPRPNSKRGRRPKTFQRDGYVLCLDPGTAGSVLTGWAIDRHHPEERRLIRLRADRQSLAVQRATLYRRDSLDGGSDGFHGFSLPLPPHGGPLFVDDLANGFEFRIS